MTLAALALLAAVQAVGLGVIMALAWLVQQRTGNSGWIDVGWTLAVGSIGAATALAFGVGNASSPGTRQLVMAAILALWSLRLASHLATRAMRLGDDPRYAELIRVWGATAPRRMLLFAQAQALAAVPLVATIGLAANRPRASLDMQDTIGLATFALGIAGAAAADRQLRSFAAQPGCRGKVCDVGLWAWSRHPNYFFEWLGWLGLAIVAIDLTGINPVGWLGVAAPAWMYWLLVHVSGIPPLEHHMLSTRGAAFQDYQGRTPAFFPWRPLLKKR